MLWTKFGYVESNSFIFDVDYMEGMKLAYFWKMWSARHLNCKHLSLVLFMSGLLYVDIFPIEIC